ncbi:MAG: N-(5'-phosphoribosyl)anthranilate isomerase [Sulfitobacter sp.]|nr:N-(5'-phosphoribosyl)anthranilate isomerase [Sulfitobacter sp.]MDG1354429.1 N-(5'-phosphoribosyl)anthranilate isomerase [Sulfitobacter sp.]
MSIPAPLSPDAWVTHLFTAKAAREGGVVRRNLRDIERYVGRTAFEAELRRRGYHAVENAGQLIIFCNQEPIRLIL